jgi:hypothetical protein
MPLMAAQVLPFADLPITLKTRSSRFTCPLVSRSCSTYVVEPQFEAPCAPFAQARNVMEEYVKRNFVQCSYLVHRKENGHEFDEEMGCHTYHFDDVSILRDRFDRNFQGTNDHDIVATMSAPWRSISDIGDFARYQDEPRVIHCLPSGNSRIPNKKPATDFSERALRFSR